MLVKQVPGVKGIYKGIYNEKQKNTTLSEQFPHLIDEKAQIE